VKTLRQIFLGVAIAAFATISLNASAQATYPSKPIKMIVPYATGGVSDIMGRVLAQKLTELIGQPVIVDNRAGAGGALGTDIAAKSAPDGYTLVLTSLTPLGIAPNLQKSIPYDAVKDFSGIGAVAMAPNILTVSATSDLHTLRDIVTFAKANPGKLSFGSSGVGSTGHLSGEMLRSTTGAEMLHIPYKSAAVAYPDMFSGAVTMVFDTLPSAIQHVRGGKARAIAVLSDKRSPLLPDVPTFAEAGYPDATLRFWVALHGPAGMPAPVVAKLNETLNKALASPDLRERFLALGADPYPSTPQQINDLVRTDLEKMARTVKAAKIQPE
jgi:tripartite-type tricarboxylate transporter receptor subunit TctC